MTDTTTAYNHLKNEQSPYLRQHARQPVDWYPWGNAAFEKAKNEDKPILVSIGYSTCHWCHVMAEESFDDLEVAALMNQYLVNVKIDREERPDLDQIYISAVSAMTGSAGWPLNVFITPEGKPFYGGTYFPPTKRVSPAWKDIVTAIGNAWQDRDKRKQLITSAGRVTDLLKSHLGGETQTGTDVNLSPDLLDAAIDAISGMYDSENGGFSTAPKFPMPAMIRFLLFYNRFARHTGRLPDKAKKAADMAVRTLEKMADGGIYDHLGGGFHRYSTDAVWHVPHFEKMLYDNGQLIGACLDAYSMTGNERFAEVARESLAYVLRDMTHPEGGFYSAEDADSIYRDLTRDPSDPDAADTEKSEGGFYVWKLEEIRHLLDKETFDIVTFHYRVLEGGNVAHDPMGEFTGKNILYRARTVSETAARFDRSGVEIADVLNRARQDLFAARNERPRPHLDDKILIEWNGLMISALAKAGRIFEEPRYLKAAEKAVHFIHDHMYEGGQHPELYRRWRDGDRKVSAMATDYAFLVQALLDTYAAGFDPWMLNWAIELGDLMIERFFDDRQGGFYTTHKDQDEHLLLRVKDATDSVIPSAASVATSNCIRLYRLTGKELYCKVTERTLQSTLQRIQKQPASVPEMLLALGSHLLRSVEVVLIGEKNSAAVQALLNEIRAFPPESLQLVFLSENTDRQALARHMPYLESMPAVENGAAAYICYNRTCQNPVHDPEALIRLLKEATEPPLRKQ